MKYTGEIEVKLDVFLNPLKSACSVWWKYCESNIPSLCRTPSYGILGLHEMSTCQTRNKLSWFTEYVGQITFTMYRNILSIFCNFFFSHIVGYKLSGLSSCFTADVWMIDDLFNASVKDFMENWSHALADTGHQSLCQWEGEMLVRFIPS